MFLVSLSSDERNINSVKMYIHLKTRAFLILMIIIYHIWIHNSYVTKFTIQIYLLTRTIFYRKLRALNWKHLLSRLELLLLLHCLYYCCWKLAVTCFSFFLFLCLRKFLSLVPLLSDERNVNLFKVKIQIKTKTVFSIYKSISWELTT